MNLATAYSAQGQYTQAEVLYQRALALQERLYGAEHPQVLEVLDASIALQRKMHPARSLCCHGPWRIAWRTGPSVSGSVRSGPGRRSFPAGGIEERRIFGDGDA